MAKSQTSQADKPTRKPLVWLHGEVKTPPFTPEGRQEAGVLLRLLQEGERLGMPQAEPLPDVGPHCGALRVRDAEHNRRMSGEHGRGKTQSTSGDRLEDWRCR